MYAIGEICYADKLVDGIKVIEAKPLRGRILLVTFSTGEKRLFDTTTLQGSAFDILDDEKIFNQPTVFQGVITWDNGKIDIAPEMVYENSYPYTAISIA